MKILKGLWEKSPKKPEQKCSSVYKIELGEIFIFNKIDQIY